jgi:hypothetical protein
MLTATGDLDEELAAVSGQPFIDDLGNWVF